MQLTSRSSRRRYAPRLNSSVSLKTKKLKTPRAIPFRFQLIVYNFGAAVNSVWLWVLILCEFLFVDGSIVGRLSVALIPGVCLSDFLSFQNR